MRQLKREIWVPKKSCEVSVSWFSCTTRHSILRMWTPCIIDVTNVEVSSEVNPSWQESWQVMNLAGYRGKFSDISLDTGAECNEFRSENWRTALRLAEEFKLLVPSQQLDLPAAIASLEFWKNLSLTACEKQIMYMVQWPAGNPNKFMGLSFCLTLQPRVMSHGEASD